MMFETQVLAWDSNKNVAGQNRLMRSQNAPFDNWITNDTIQVKINNKKTCTDSIPLQKATYYHKNE